MHREQRGHHPQGHAFLGFDDTQYVYDNARVRAGLNWDNLRWAFGTLHFSNWHPLTWLSHMLDVELFGVSAGAHHLVNAVLHAANAQVARGWMVVRGMARVQPGGLKSSPRGG